MPAKLSAMNLIANLKRRIRDCVQYLKKAVVTAKGKNGDSVPTSTCNVTTSSWSGSIYKDKIQQANTIPSLSEPTSPLPSAVSRSPSPPISESDSQVEPYVAKVWRCTCDDRRWYSIWPAGDGGDVQMNERAYDKFLSRTGDPSGIEQCQLRGVRLLFWRVHLTPEEFHEALTWPETVSGSLLDLCQVHDRLQIPERKDPTRKQYIVWGTDECWNNHETASRGSENLLAITGSSSLIEASYRTKLPSGVTYWRVELREDEIPKVQDLLEVRLVERANLLMQYPFDDISIPLPRRLRRPMRT